MNNKIEEIKRKILKLKALYDGALNIESEHEAEAAARQMNALLMEYNLSLEEIGTLESNDNPLVNEPVTYAKKWEVSLATVLSNYNFCKACFIRGEKKLMFFGRKENVALVSWLFSMLKDRYIRLANVRYMEHKKTSIKKALMPYAKSTFFVSYLQGCVVGLEIKLVEEKNRNESMYPSMAKAINSLVVRSSEEVNDYIKSIYKKIKKTNSNSNIGCSQAYQNGIEEGKNTILNRPISSQKESVEKRMLGS